MGALAPRTVGIVSSGGDADPEGQEFLDEPWRLRQRLRDLEPTALKKYLKDAHEISLGNPPMIVSFLLRGVTSRDCDSNWVKAGLA